MTTPKSYNDFLDVIRKTKLNEIESQTEPEPEPAPVPEKKPAKKIVRRRSAVVQLKKADEIVKEFNPVNHRKNGLMLPHLIGSTVETAGCWLAEIGWLIRVVREDGKTLECDNAAEFARVSVSVWYGQIVGIEDVESAPETEELEMPKVSVATAF